MSKPPTGGQHVKAATASTEAATTKAAPKPKGNVRHIDLKLPQPPMVKASAKAMAEHLDSYAEQLRRVAQQLRDKPPGDTLIIPWPPGGGLMSCNGGSDGGDGGGDGGGG